MQIPFLHKKKTVIADEAPMNMVYRVRIAVIGIIGIMLGALLVFLYRDFYQTIVQARVVIVLKKEVALENIELKLFNRVNAIHTYKTTSLLNKPIADPFDTESELQPQNVIPLTDESEASETL